MRSRCWLVVTSILVVALVASTLAGPARLAAAAAEPGDLSIPYGSSGWRYQVVAHGGPAGLRGSPACDDSDLGASAPRRSAMPGLRRHTGAA